MIEAKKNSRFGFVKHLFDPFEFLYMAIAVATFEHSTWTAAYMFEGLPPAGGAELNMWYFKGALIAIAIDVGMLMTSRFIAATTDRGEVLTLIMAFGFAALASLFTQIGYIAFHTPSFTISTGVSAYWQGILNPLIEARVIILPFFLPLMGTIYTIARIYRTKRIKREHIEIQERVNQQNALNRGNGGKPYILVESLADVVKLLDDGMRPKLPQEIVDDEFVDWEHLRFYDVDKGIWRGTYPNVETMIKTMRALAEKRQKDLALPASVDAPTDAGQTQ